jgi:hypothetical protein
MAVKKRLKNKKSWTVETPKCYAFYQARLSLINGLFFHSISQKPDLCVGFFYTLMKVKFFMTPQQNLLKKTMAKPAVNTLSELSRSLTLLQGAVIELVQKQSTLMEKLDQFINKVVVHEERLKRLEDNSLSHLESATWIKAGIKFWPLIIACLLLGHQIHALLLNYRLH